MLIKHNGLGEDCQLITYRIQKVPQLSMKAYPVKLNPLTFLRIYVKLFDIRIDIKPL